MGLFSGFEGLFGGYETLWGGSETLWGGSPGLSGGGNGNGYNFELESGTGLLLLEDGVTFFEQEIGP